HPSDRRALAISIEAATRVAATRTVGTQHARRFHAARRLTSEQREIVIDFLDDMAREISIADVDWGDPGDASGPGRGLRPRQQAQARGGGSGRAPVPEGGGAVLPGRSARRQDGCQEWRAGTGSTPRCGRRPTREGTSTGRPRGTRRSVALINMARTPRARTSPQGAGANHRNLAVEEPDGHAVGRSRGGLSSKVHAAVDGNGMPLAIVLTGGQRNDGAMLVEVLDDIRV